VPKLIEQINAVLADADAPAGPRAFSSNRALSVFRGSQT
jgi:hypothetical protein